jgi:Ca2+-binding RTX toxin-like protein
MARIVLALVAASLFLAAPAQAAVTTSFSGGTLTILMSASGDTGTVRVGDSDPGGGRKLVVNDVPQSTATTATTNSISFQDNSGNGNTTAVIDFAGGSFEPGQLNEAGASDEIEFLSFNLGSGTDEVVIRAAQGGDRILLGSAGINLNPEEADGVDTDVPFAAFQGVEAVRYEGGDGVDEVNAAGGTGSDVQGTSPFSLALRLNGYGGDDKFTGGSGADNMSGGNGADTLIGGAGDETMTGGEGDDRLEGQAGNDSLDGQNGNDTQISGDGNDTHHLSLGNDLLDAGGETPFITSDVLSAVNLYADGTIKTGLTIDLAVTGPQDTRAAGIDTFVDVEDILGSPYDDVLKGNDDPTFITGADGNDIVESRGGADRLFGGNGDDALDPGNDNVQDTVSGDDGFDAVSYASRSVGIQVTLADSGDGAGGTGETADVLQRIEGVTGSSGDDTLVGNAANNVLDGGPGQDQLQGNGGDDTLRSQDGVADALNCGSGNDAWVADAIDDVGPSCERPYTLPNDDPAGPSGDRAPALRWSVNKRVKARKGVFSVRATCPPPSINRCRGSATLLRAKGSRSIARTRFDIPNGATRSIRIKLAKAAFRQLKRKRKLVVRLRITSRDDGGVAPSKTVKFTLTR